MYSVLRTIIIVDENQALLGTKYFAELDRWYGETMARDDTLRGLRKLQVRCSFVLKTSSKTAGNSGLRPRDQHASMVSSDWSSTGRR